jgi:hypothetical protein
VASEAVSDLRELADCAPAKMKVPERRSAVTPSEINFFMAESFFV